MIRDHHNERAIQPSGSGHMLRNFFESEAQALFLAPDFRVSRTKDGVDDLLMAFRRMVFVDEARRTYSKSL